MSGSNLKKRFARGLGAVGIKPADARALRHWPTFLREMRSFRDLGGSVDEVWPLLADRAEGNAAIDPHYFTQDIYVAEQILVANPIRHVDIGSRVDGFISHLAVFREVEVFDIRPADREIHPNITFRQADLFDLDMGAIGDIPSLSCLHSIEHFGLGRYGDSLDPQGHVEGFRRLAQAVSPGGVLYVSFPVGVPKTVFNAHRIIDPTSAASWAESVVDLERFSYIDDQGRLHCDVAPRDAAAEEYGCGIYAFRRR
jgi:hypothetical protein